MRLNPPSLIFIFIFLIFTLLFVLTFYPRVMVGYLEDDSLWLFPLVWQMKESLSFPDFIYSLHQGELTLFDGLYAMGLKEMFGFRVGAYVACSLFLHWLNVILLFFLLFKGLKLSLPTSVTASLMYLCFYGHFHCIVWPLAAHHLVVISFILLILFFYLKTDERLGKQEGYFGYYGIVLSLSLVASFLRLSVLLIPCIMFGHLILTARDKRDGLFKYDRWVWLFFIMTIYQGMVLCLGSQGDVLSDFLEPIHTLLGEKGSFRTTICWMVATAFALLIARVLLPRLVEIRQRQARWLKIIAIVFLLIVLTPHLSLCVFVFLNPLRSALSADLLSRWQPISFPASDWMTIIEVAGLVLVILLNLHYIKHHNKNLIIFLFLAIGVWPFLHSQDNYIYSRYLMYISVVFCVFLALFFLEILPRYWGQQKKAQPFYYLCFFLCLSFLLIVNLFSIQIRLTKTALIDHHWSYDYIRIANVIKEDLLKKGALSQVEEHIICVQGVEEIPYADSWKKGFLRSFESGRYDPFRWTLTSVLPRPPQLILVNQDCPKEALSYRFTEKGLRDRNDTPVEPFYTFLGQGMVLYKGGGSLAKRGFF